MPWETRDGQQNKTYVEALMSATCSIFSKHREHKLYGCNISKMKHHLLHIFSCFCNTEKCDQWQSISMSSIKHIYMYSTFVELNQIKMSYDVGTEWISVQVFGI